MNTLDQDIKRLEREANARYRAQYPADARRSRIANFIIDLLPVAIVLIIIAAALLCFCYKGHSQVPVPVKRNALSIPAGTKGASLLVKPLTAKAHGTEVVTNGCMVCTSPANAVTKFCPWPPTPRPVRPGHR